MKKDIHPKEYRKVIFHDNTSGERFLIASTVLTEEKDTWTDKKEYPLYRVEISSASHPFYTGKHTVVDTAGRVQRFNTRMARSTEKKSAIKPKKVKKPKSETGKKLKTSKS